MQLTTRQQRIVELVRAHGPIAAEDLATRLELTRAAIRADLSVLTMTGHLEARPRVGYSYIGRESFGSQAERLRDIRVRDVQAVPVVIREDTSLYDAIVTTFLEDTGTMFVVNQAGALVGAVSRSDLLRAAVGQADLQKIPVGMVMTRGANLISVSPEDSVISAARKLSSHHIYALPVLRRSRDGVNEITGVINLATVASLVAEFAEIH